MKKLLFISLLAGLLGGWQMLKAEPKQLPVAHECPQWICTPEPDSRSVAQYIDECVPEWGPNDYDGMYCTQNINPLDADDQMPVR